ncbi:MAG: urease accessory protein UreD [Haliangiales bacterium]
MWPASLSLALERRSHRTVLARCRHRGPLRVQRALYPEDTCHIYLLHPPGGVVGGDSLDVEVAAAAGARGLITTPAAGKLYRSDRRWATLTQRCRVADQASVEWFPHENIVFDNAWARVTTEVELAPEATFIGWDITCLGRPASGERFAHGACIQRMSVRRGGALLWMEHNRYEGGAARMEARWGLGGYSVCATLVAIAAQSVIGADAAAPATAVAPNVTAWLSALRDELGRAPGPEDAQAGVTALGPVIVCRYLGREAEHARAVLIRLWARLRPLIVGRAAVPPRIWAT